MATCEIFLWRYRCREQFHIKFAVTGTSHRRSHTSHYVIHMTGLTRIGSEAVVALLWFLSTFFNHRVVAAYFRYSALKLHKVSTFTYHTSDHNAVFGFKVMRSVVLHTSQRLLLYHWSLENKVCTTPTCWQFVTFCILHYTYITVNKIYSTCLQVVSIHWRRVGCLWI